MNARWTLRALCCAFLTALTLSVFSAPARAGYPFNNGYCREHACYGNTLQFYPTAPVLSCYRRTTLLVPTYNVCIARPCYPITVFDSFGRPYVVYQTGYANFVR